MGAILTWKLTPGENSLAAVPMFQDLKLSTLDEASTILPSGVYTTLRTYQGDKVLNFSEHIQRLERSAALTGQPIQINQEWLRASLRALIKNFDQQDVRIRITAVPGTGGELTFFVSMGVLTIPGAEARANGVRVISKRLSRENPEAKLTDFILTTRKLRTELPAGVNEILLVSADGIILEGMTSNFFAIKNNQIWSAGKGILPGITRSLVLEVITNKGLLINLDGYPLDRVMELDEAFITSTSRGILPVVKIDQTIIGTGIPGELTRELACQLESVIKERLESL